MPNYADSIDGFVVGDDLEVRRAVTDIPTGQTLTKAWLTIKTSLSQLDSEITQKVITTTDVPGTGAILDDGTGDAAGVLRFDLSPADTVKYAKQRIRQVFYFDIQVQTSGGKLYTPFKGTVDGEPQVTLAAE